MDEQKRTVEDKVTCPWCGHEMELHYAETDVMMCFACMNCGAHSPLVLMDFEKSQNDLENEVRAEAHKLYKEPRKPIRVWDVQFLGVPYIAEYKGVEGLFCYVSGNGVAADMAAARELGFAGKTINDLFLWESKPENNLVCRLWECGNRHPTKEEREAVPWEGYEKHA